MDESYQGNTWKNALDFRILVISRANIEIRGLTWPDKESDGSLQEKSNKKIEDPSFNGLSRARFRQKIQDKAV